MEREQIIKALECCTNFTPSSCDNCPFEPKGDCYKGSMGCNDELMKNALALIKELTEENERLRDTAYRLECEVHRERADTVKKMQFEINKTLSELCKGDVSEISRMIDQIAKEMLEGE